ncbi:hypothetical protein CGC21_21220 [Leishmania donovani]|uniref:Uncharacterized protein n=1 Tax=Leishmania donovani TaxID=5661 RepID=A0A504X8C7_LEIDO|nr:hypothetical protein CGC21_21220 [Leishmania donovani]
MSRPRFSRLCTEGLAVALRLPAETALEAALADVEEALQEVATAPTSSSRRKMQGERPNARPALCFAASNGQAHSADVLPLTHSTVVLGSPTVQASTLAGLQHRDLAKRCTVKATESASAGPLSSPEYAVAAPAETVAQGLEAQPPPCSANLQPPAPRPARWISMAMCRGERCPAARRESSNAITNAVNKTPSPTPPAVTPPPMPSKQPSELSHVPLLLRDAAEVNATRGTARYHEAPQCTSEDSLSTPPVPTTSSSVSNSHMSKEDFLLSSSPLERRQRSPRHSSACLCQGPRCGATATDWTRRLKG